MSSNYDGCYIKLADNPTFWLVEDGERRPMSGEDVQSAGLRPVVVLDVGELTAIPVRGSRKAKSRKAETKKASEEESEE